MQEGRRQQPLCCCSLGLLACRIQEGSVETLLQELCTKLFTSKKEHERDLASIGLKTVVAEVSVGPLGKSLVKRVTPHLISGVKTQVPSAAPSSGSLACSSLVVPLLLCAGVASKPCCPETVMHNTVLRPWHACSHASL